MTADYRLGKNTTGTPVVGYPLRVVPRAVDGAARPVHGDKRRYWQRMNSPRDFARRSRRQASRPLYFTAPLAGVGGNFGICAERKRTPAHSEFASGIGCEKKSHDSAHRDKFHQWPPPLRYCHTGGYTGGGGGGCRLSTAACCTVGGSITESSSILLVVRHARELFISLLHSQLRTPGNAILSFIKTFLFPLFHRPCMYTPQPKHPLQNESARALPDGPAAPRKVRMMQEAKLLMSGPRTQTPSQ